MKCRYKVAATIVVGLCSLVPRTAIAQGSTVAAGKAAQPEPSKPTPRTADGHPDLTGYWIDKCPFGHACTAPPPSQDGKTGTGIQRPVVPPGTKNPEAYSFEHFDDPTIAGRKADPNQPPYKPELLSQVNELDAKENKLDPAFYCKPFGIPRVGAPQKIVEYPGGIVFLYTNEKGNTYRDIPTDGRQHDSLDTDTYFGDSVGHWEGDTLVIDAVGFTDDTWLGYDGWFHTTSMHVVERLTREGETIRYQATVEDPNVFTTPWAMDPRTLKLGNSFLIETPPCIEKDADHIVTGQHH